MSEGLSLWLCCVQVPLRGNSEALEAYVAWEMAQAEPQELPAHVQVVIFKMFENLITTCAHQGLMRY